MSDKYRWCVSVISLNGNREVICADKCLSLDEAIEEKRQVMGDIEKDYCYAVHIDSYMTDCSSIVPDFIEKAIHISYAEKKTELREECRYKEMELDDKMREEISKKEKEIEQSKTE